jgi:diacylglycerol kinase family enzyme
LLVADMQSRPRLNHLLRGYPLYLIAAARVGLRPPNWQVRVDADGQPWYEGPMTNLVINNCRIHAGEFDVTPDARPNDGLLDAVLIPHLPMNLYRYAVGFRHMPDFMKRSAPINWLRPRRHQARHFSITLATPSPVQVDGEYFAPVSHIAVGIRPAAARISVPTRCDWAA